MRGGVVLSFWWQMGDGRRGMELGICKVRYTTYVLPARSREKPRVKSRRLLGWCAGGVEVAHGSAVVDGEEAELDDVADRRRDGVGREHEAAEGDADRLCGGDGMCHHEGGEEGE